MNEVARKHSISRNQSDDSIRNLILDRLNESDRKSSRLWLELIDYDLKKLSPGHSFQSIRESLETAIVTVPVPSAPSQNFIISDENSFHNSGTLSAMMTRDHYFKLWLKFAETMHRESVEGVRLIFRNLIQKFPSLEKNGYYYVTWSNVEKSRNHLEKSKEVLQNGIENGAQPVWIIKQALSKFSTNYRNNTQEKIHRNSLVNKQPDNLKKPIIPKTFKFGTSGRHPVGRVPLTDVTNNTLPVENSKNDSEKSNDNRDEKKELQNIQPSQTNSPSDIPLHPSSLDSIKEQDEIPTLRGNLQTKDRSPSLSNPVINSLNKTSPKLTETPPQNSLELSTQSSTQSSTSGSRQNSQSSTSLSVSNSMSSSEPISAPQTAVFKFEEDIISVNKNPYWKLNLLGKGGSSRVYRVLSSDRSIYALKQVDTTGVESNIIAQYLEEIKLLEKLKSFHCIISLIDKEITPKCINIVLECGEIDLAGILSRYKEGLLSHKNNINYLRLYWQQILESVSVIHQQRIVHGDLKPQNFVMVAGILKLIDFGIAKAIHGNTTNIERETITGTLNYLAPETLLSTKNGTSKSGRAADVWSLGCILYQMVYGKPPLAKEGIVSSIRILAWLSNNSQKIVLPQPVPPGKIGDIILACLERDPRNRPSVSKLLTQELLT